MLLFLPSSFLFLTTSSSQNRFNIHSDSTCSWFEIRKLAHPRKGDKSMSEPSSGKTDDPVVLELPIKSGTPGTKGRPLHLKSSLPPPAA